MRLGRRASTLLYIIAILTGYGALVVWLTWPLAASVRSSLPAEGFASVLSQIDLYYSTWALSWGSHALVSAGARFADANIYHPASNAIFYGPAGLGALPLFAPIFLVTGNPALAVNITFLLGITLTGIAMHWVIKRWTGSDLAGVVGATTVVANQWLIHGFVPVTPHWATLFWMPLIAFLAATQLDSFRWVLVLAVLIVLQCLTDLVYVGPAVAAPLGCIAGLRLLKRKSCAKGARLVVALVLAALMLAPLYRRYQAVQADNPDLVHQTKWTATDASLPGPMPRVLFHGARPFLLMPVVVGVIAIGSLAGLWRRRSGGVPRYAPGGWAHGALWAVIGGTLSLSPVVVIGGAKFLTPMGYLITWLPLLRTIRVSSRLGVAGMVGVGILCGMAFAEICALIRTYVRRRDAAYVVSAALAVLVVHLVYRAYVANYWTFTGPGKMPDAFRLQAVPSIPEELLSVLESSPAPLLELPVSSPSDTRAHALAMFHSIAHWRPILNGYSSYWPVGFPERMADAARLPDAKALDSLVEATGLSLIWVHLQSLDATQQRAWTSLTPATGARWRLALVARAGPEVLFEVEPQAAGANFGK